MTKIVKTYTLKGFISIEYDDSKTIKLSDGGWKIDVVNRFIESKESYPNHKCQVNYWISDKEATKDEMIEGVLKNLYGVIDAEYGKDTYHGSSLTGSWSEHYTTLNIGGHNLLDELSSYNGKYIIIELNFSK